jgi:urease accessory protein
MTNSPVCEPQVPDGAGLQRARGQLSIGFRVRDGATVLDTLRQQGCLKCRLPRRLDAGWREAICLNNSGGVAGGDELSTRLLLGAGTSAVLTSASAERIYRCRADEAPARIANAVLLGDDARAEWLPQETILFDSSRLTRRLDVVMAGSARLLGVETLVFGRVAMGEAVRSALLRDVISIRRDGRLILHDVVRPPEDSAAASVRMAVAGGARASTTLFWVAPQAAAALSVVRDVLAAHTQVHAGASAWDGMLVVRMLARDPARSRDAVAALLLQLREGRMLPRVWSC